MKEYLPYIVSIVSAVISFLGSLLVNKRSNKNELEKVKLEHENILLRNKQEQDAKIEQLEKEYALKLGTQMITSITDKTVDAVYSSNVVKNEINKNANKAFVSQKGKRKKK